MKRFYPAITLLMIAILSYGLLIPQMGFYWDDLPISWIRYQLGPEALTEYFSTNRPVWGVLYQITTRIFPQVPIYWQVFALFWRWLGAAAVWGITHQLWKDKPRFGLGVALLFLVFPGFNQQWASFLYGHFFVVLFFFLFSILCMLWSINQPNRYWLWTSIGMLSSALNLWMMEYFFTLELFRIGVIWTALRDDPVATRDRIKRALGLWSPYLGVLALAVLSRLFIFNNEVYGISLTEQLKTAPLGTMKDLAESMLLSLRLVIRDSWMQVFRFPDPLIEGRTIYFAIVILAAIAATLGILLLSKDRPRIYRAELKDSTYAISLGALAVFMAGWPFWLIGFEPSLAWPANRFTLPFMIGVSLILAGLISLIPWQSVRYFLIIVLVAFAAGRQFLWSQDYRDDWNTQKDLFWQLTWRAPGIQPDTLVLLNEGALDYYADNSLSPALNWIYAPNNHSDRVEYVLFYPTTRLRNALPALREDIPIYFDYLSGEFNGNTSQTLAIYYQPPGCLRVLDPEIEGRNRTIRETSLMRFAAHISSPDLIIDEPRARMPEVYSPEPAHGWCYYFQRADLARQFGAWEEVISIGNAAFELNHDPKDPIELFVFIEGYAHAGQWQRALELSEESYQAFKQNEVAGRLLCLLWERIEAETPEDEERSEALSEVKNIFACNP